MSQIKAGAALSYAAVIFNTAAGLLYTPWMVSCIGADDYGLYTLALSVINFFLLDFGLSDSVSRFLSKYYAEGREDLVSGFLGMTYKLYLVITAVIAAVLIVVFLNINAIYSGLTAEQLPVFRVLFVVISLYSVVSFPFTPLNGVLISNERFVALNACNLVQKVATVGLIVVALLLDWGVYALVVVNALVSVVMTACKFVIVRARTEAHADFSYWKADQARELVGFSAWVTVTQVCARLIFAVMPSIIAMTATTAEVALFGLASSLEGYVYTVASALNGMFMPKVSRSLAGVDEGLQHMMTRVGRIQLYIIGFIFVCFAALGGRFAACWMGPGYDALWPCALLLVLPSVVELPQLIGVTAITASGNVRARGLVYIGTALINVILGMVLTRAMGALGACVSICIAYFFRTFGENVIYRKRLGIRLRAFFRDTFGRWAVAGAATLAVGFFSSWAVPVSGWSGFIACGLVMFAAYVLLLRAFVINEYEKELVAGVFVAMARHK